MIFVQTVLQSGFQEASGITDTTFFGGITAMVLLLSISFLFIYSLNTKGKKRIKTFPYFYLALFSLLMTERVTTAYADYMFYRPLKIANDVVFWRPRSSSRLFGKALDYRLPPGNTPKSLTLYSGKKPVDKKALPNIVVVMLESFRGDMIDEDLMPYISTASGSLFRNHYSTSNSTHFGIYPIFFGLFPNHYQTTVENSYKPPLFEAARDLGYTTNLVSSTDFNWWGMNKFVNDELFDKFIIHHDKKENTAVRDRKSTDTFKTLFKQGTAPNFFFISLKSTHYNYHYPDTPEFRRYMPVIDGKTSLVAHLYRQDVEKVLNRYKNSIYYTDTLLKEMADHIKSENGWDDTLFIVFGDHGEAFFENGRIGHINNLDFYQTSAMLFIHRPGDSEHSDVTDKTTSHLDVLPTIVEVLRKRGIDVDHPDWLKGHDLFDENFPEGRFVYFADAQLMNPKNYAMHKGKTVCKMTMDLFDEECMKILEEGLDGFKRVAGVEQ
jgi:membrane-anchored protein YejM (alkaline phosphatase superfamily)